MRARAPQRQGARLLAAAAVLACAPGLAACESSQSKSARLESQAKVAAPAEQGLTIRAPSKTLTAADVTVLTGDQGTAAVVVDVKNEGEAAYAVPLLVKVTDDAGTEIFTNGIPGLQPSLTQLAFAEPGASTTWVNDQIPYTGDAQLSAEVTIGDGTGTAPTTPVNYKTTTPKLEQDPVSGVAAKGYVKHDVDTEQQRVLVTVIGRKDGKVVAAGRAIVERVKAGKRAVFTAFLLGDPAGAELTATASSSLENANLAEEATSTP